MSPVIQAPYPSIVAPAVIATGFTEANAADAWAWQFVTGTKTVVDGGRDKVLEVTSAATHGVITWASPGLRADGEVLCKVRQSTGTGSRGVGIGLRIGGTAAERQGYTLGWNSGISSPLSFNKGSTTTFTPFTPAIHASYPTSLAFTRAALTDYWLRFRMVGSVMFGKAWADGSAEPGDWMVAGVDATFAAAGLQGFWRATTFDTHQLDYFAVSQGTIPVPT